jgi:hypothetical protein
LDRTPGYVLPATVRCFNSECPVSRNATIDVRLNKPFLAVASFPYPEPAAKARARLKDP